MNEKGQVLREFQIEHNPSGFAQIEQVRIEQNYKPENCIVGLETAHNLLVDFLWDQDYQEVYILPPRAVKSAQSRYRQSGAKDDRWDARLIADLLRTDRNRYTIWKPDSPLTRQIRTAVRFIYNLNKDITRNTNRLRDILYRYYPAAINIFSELDNLISLKFIQAYPSPLKAKELSFEEFKDFLQKNHYKQPKHWAACYSRLQETYFPVHQEVINAYEDQAATYAEITEKLVRSKNKWLKKLKWLYDQHPDREIYASLPGAGELLEPALLAKLGDDRKRFPNASVLQAVAGTCPVTKSSGKKHSIYFRKSCDHQFRFFVQQWARLSLIDSPWANTYFQLQQPHCRTRNDAFRRLGNRWLAILWKLWQDHSTYDEIYHLRQRDLHSSRR
jgi:transposase